MSKTLKLKHMMELVAKKAMKENKPGSKFSLDEGSAISTEALRDLVDDFMMHNEMLIDEHYGNLNLEEFKKLYYNAASKFDKEISAIINNMSGQSQQPAQPQGQR